MKKSILPLVFFFILTVFVSCDDNLTSSHGIAEIEISEHVLPDYFVTAISFDSKGTAWIGTYK